MERIEGLIKCSQGGFYDVQTASGVLECQGRGLFRKDDITLLVGDRVLVQPTEAGRGSIVELLPRRNTLVRPPVANIALLALIVSCADPAPNLYVIDKLTAIAARRGIEAALIFTKSDLAEAESCAEIYRRCGYPVAVVSSATGEGREAAAALVQSSLTVFCGNTGAGKSSLLNLLYPQYARPVGETSKKLGRGRHTTRHVELFENGSGGWIADTPGFSAVEFLRYEQMTADHLESCFPEFARHIPDCRFTGCSHRSELGCAVLAAVERGEIPKSRHKSYLALYEELKDIKEWQLSTEKEERR